MQSRERQFDSSVNRH
nr:unnamed protein product [Callosobruchus chinensis]